MYVVWVWAYHYISVRRFAIFIYTAVQYTVATPSIGHLKYAMSLFEMIFYKR